MARITGDQVQRSLTFIADRSRSPHSPVPSSSEYGRRRKGQVTAERAGAPHFALGYQLAMGTV